MSDLLLSSNAPRPIDYLDSRYRPASSEVSSTWDAEPAFSEGMVVDDMDDSAVCADEIEGLPLALVHLYAEIADRHAQVKEVDPGVYAAIVAGLEGAWGEGEDEDEARRELKEAIIGWVAVKRRIGATDIPLMEGIDLNPRT